MSFKVQTMMLWITTATVDEPSSLVYTADSIIEPFRRQSEATGDQPLPTEPTLSKRPHMRAQLTTTTVA